VREHTTIRSVRTRRMVLTCLNRKSIQKSNDKAVNVGIEPYALWKIYMYDQQKNTEPVTTDELFFFPEDNRRKNRKKAMILSLQQFEGIREFDCAGQCLFCSSLFFVNFNIPFSTADLFEYSFEQRPVWMEEEEFVHQIALTGSLPFLKWAKEIQQPPLKWDKYTIAAAAGTGNLELLKYCVENECPGFQASWTIACASGNGRLEALKYLHEKNKNKIPWTWEVLYYAKLNKQYDCLEYAIKFGCPGTTLTLW
jgi:hypothetical protein